jgi:hypothetical protein
MEGPIGCDGPGGGEHAHERAALFEGDEVCHDGVGEDPMPATPTP